MSSAASAACRLYQLHTRAWLTRLSKSDKTLCSLREIPDSELDQIAALGFNWIWLLGIWQTGQAALELSRTAPQWQAEFREALPDLQPQDISGSTFAITAYQVHRDFGGKEALESLRARLASRGLKLMLDFVPNHTAPDHPWVWERPDDYIAGTPSDIEREPGNFLRVETQFGERILARGRDPYFPAWPDTLQLNYGNLALQSAMLAELSGIASQCDGVRCDMAMLILPEVFQRTWGFSVEPFWPAALTAARRVQHDFVFMAEVYWGLDRQLQELGFDFTYDKTLYDQLVHRNVTGIRNHLRTDLPFLRRSVHFLENHDERRIAEQLPLPIHKAAAAISYLIPGLQFFHDGQLDGYLRKPSIHLGRRAIETANPAIRTFYDRLLKTLKDPAIAGVWTLLEAVQAWHDDDSNQAIIGFAWSEAQRMTALAAINYADHSSRCYLPLGSIGWEQNPNIVITDLLGSEQYVRPVRQLKDHGLYLAVEPWAAQLFRISPGPIDSSGLAER